MAKPSAKSLIPKRKRLDFDGARKPKSKEIDEAIELGKTAGFAVKMERHLQRRKDGPPGMNVDRNQGSAAARRSCGSTWLMGPSVTMTSASAAFAE